MTDVQEIESHVARSKKLPIIAAIVAVVGLVDSIYLTIHHYTAEPVPCSIIEGCEMVLTSAYATFAGIPIAVFGAMAYADALGFAVIWAMGKSIGRILFGVQSTIMAAVSIWLIYIQAAKINAFCQFCLLSAATSITLFVIFVLSVIASRKN
ncbi:MAG: vitamin K epoxide reductase family protein [Pyrinomonadaceae bacterium]